MNQNQITQTDPLAILEAHEAAQAEMARVKRFTGPTVRFSGPLNSPERPTWPRLEGARDLLAALPAPPSREEAIAACMAELERLAANFKASWGELATALKAEMAAAIEAEAAKIRRRYALNYRLLEMSTKNLPVEQAQKAFEAAEYQRRVISTRRTTALKHVEDLYPGADLARPETWPAGAASRIDKVWGEHYQRGQIEEIKKQTGLTDKMLNFLARGQ